MAQHRVLFLIDDDEDDREMLELQLKRIDNTFHVITAIDGQDALEKLEQKMFIMPDLIFLDINMPIMDGKEFLKEIKKSSRFKQIPVVIFSTSTSQRDKDETAKLGASFYLPKPARYNDLAKSLPPVLQSLLQV